MARGLRKRVDRSLLDHAAVSFRKLVSGLGGEVRAADPSPQLTEPFRDLVLRRSHTQDGAFFVDVLDISCMTPEEKYHWVRSTLPVEQPAGWGPYQ